MSSQPKSPAKRKQPPAGPEVKTTRITRSSAAGQQQITSCQPESPKQEKTKCKVCSKEFVNLLCHLKKIDTCAAQYDIPTMEAEGLRRRKERKALTNKEHYKQNASEIKAATKEYYKTHTPEKRAAMTKYNKQHRTDQKEYNRQHKEDRKAKARKYYQHNKEKILKRMALQRKVHFEKKTDYNRFMDFKNAMKNVCAYGCICCHRILSSTGEENKVKGGIEGLEKELKGLFKDCILNRDELPPQLKNAKDVYLCGTCNRWLKDYKEKPPMSYKNGLGVDPIPPGLKDLNELEEPLIARRIIFLKIFNLPVSSTKSRTL